jgi:serine O-acetyltransferase
MQFSEYRYLVGSDLYRYKSRKDTPTFIRNLLFNPGFKYTFWMRSAKYFRKKKLLLFFHIICRLFLNHYKFKYGISIPYDTSIGAGFYIGHFGGIVVNPAVIIGRNCNINQDVSIGATYGGRTPGVPSIGDNVYLGPGSKIIGGIRVGNGAAIGANCVVNKSIDDHSVAAGNPFQIVSHEGASRYVINTNY